MALAASTKPRCATPRSDLRDAVNAGVAGSSRWRVVQWQNDGLWSRMLEVRVLPRQPCPAPSFRVASGRPAALEQDKSGIPHAAYVRQKTIDTLYSYSRHKVSIVCRRAARRTKSRQTRAAAAPPRRLPDASASSTPPPPPPRRLLDASASSTGRPTQNPCRLVVRAPRK